MSVKFFACLFSFYHFNQYTGKTLPKKILIKYTSKIREHFFKAMSEGIKDTDNADLTAGAGIHCIVFSVKAT